MSKKSITSLIRPDLSLDENIDALSKLYNNKFDFESVKKLNKSLDLYSVNILNIIEIIIEYKKTITKTKYESNNKNEYFDLRASEILLSISA